MFFLQFITAILVNGVIGAEVRIKSVDEFISFKNNVSNGTNYYGTTVFLDSDLDFTGKTFEPIGYYNSWNDYKDFSGVFDGQGHVISNLVMNSSSQYAGLFGYSKGLTIKNVILDSSCSITSSYSGSDNAYVGGIIGYCYTDYGPCTIENSVNMGNVIFSGTISGYNCLYLGGIAGRLYSDDYDSAVKNCANYGDVTHSGTSSTSYIGGIAGDSYSSSSSPKRVYIYNSLNHGTITNKGTTSYLYIGGITGRTYSTTIENCVSGGEISSNKTTYIGSIAGNVNSGTFINYCYFTSDLSGYGKYGYTRSNPSESNTFDYDSTTFKLDGAVSIGDYTGTSLIDALNTASNYYTLRDYSHWLLNRNKKDVSFTINGRTNPIKMNYQVILLPSLASEGKLWFGGWYEDSELTTPHTELEISSNAKLYGRFEENINNYTITFDTRVEGVSVPSITAPFGTVVTLPSKSIKGKYIIAYWETKYGDNLGLSLAMPSHNITLYAVWGYSHIETPDDFIDFSKSVNKGVSYAGTTVFLDSDLDFTGKSFEPIGTSSNCFNGVFYGQGHAISNLVMTSSSQYVGLFRYSGGLTIKNVILDSSCFITSSFIISSYNHFVGGIVGYCLTWDRPCTIENSVNMGSVTFSGNISGYNYLYLGGIAGGLYSDDYNSAVKNCANYGDVTHSGTSIWSYIGGIVGDSRGHIYNSLNHGTIMHNGTTSSSLYIGGIAGYLYSSGYDSTVKNCANYGDITHPGMSHTSYIGGIVGSSEGPESNRVYIYNSLNQGTITHKGTSSFKLHLGGIVGYLYSRYYESTMKNCANYGDVIHSGTSEDSYIGGIVGESYGSSFNRLYIYNSLNHGTVTHNGTTSRDLYLGGIAGWTYYTTIENCVSGGKFSLITKAPEYNSIGSIVRYVSSDTSINYCYYTSDLSGYTKRSGSFSYDNTTFQLSGTVSIGSYNGTSLIDVLNSYSDYYTLRDYSRWLLNKKRNDVTFTINRNSPFTMNFQVILLPNLASEGKLWFDVWYTNNELTTSFKGSEITSETELYGRFKENTNNYTISFDTRRGVSVESITASFGSIVMLPSDLRKAGCLISFWENKYGDKVENNFVVPAHDITLYAVWKCIRIETSEDFIDLSRVVNNGVDYLGTTVFLDSDLDFTGKTFEPIGNSYSNLFRGVFDGQGNVLSNLKITSSSKYVGLFGYSYGLTIRNVILDSSCSIASSYIGSNNVYVGGIIGECYAYNGKCVIENSVNMGSVTFSGNISGYNYLYLGGIAGEMYSYSTVKNCANYGDVTHSGTSSKNSYIGGIVGSSKSDSYKVFIYNSLNLGTITHNGKTSSSLYLGGIAGYTYSTTIENCVSGGEISSKKSSYVGSIVGYADSYTSINYCYYTNELSEYDKYGKGTPLSESNTPKYDSEFQLSGTVSIGNYTGNSLIDALNAAADYYTLRDYSNWILNKGKKIVSFTINRNSPFTMNSQIILLPSLASEGKLWFYGWYEDSGYSKIFTSNEVTSDKELYGKFSENTNNYTISFDTRREGVSVAPITAPFGSVVTLPSGLSRDNCTFVWWENKYGDEIDFNFTIPSHNIILYAVWKCTHIKTVEDFIDFSNVVNKGTNYYGTTVFLDSDIKFTGETFEPIGYYNTYNDPRYFRGVFDGQGYVISNLKIISLLQNIGLFGYSTGLTIRNVILDSSCSVTSSFNGSGGVFAGGIVGYCLTWDRPCIIENSVNMGSVTFSGNISYSLWLGGIAGCLEPSSSYESIMKNCANYGDVTHSGASGYNSYIGGIVGSSEGPEPNRIYIYNSLNHVIENCVSGGKILSNKTSCIGSIVGYVYEGTTINYCFFTSELSGYKECRNTHRVALSESNTFSYNNITFRLNGTVSIGSHTCKSLNDALNAYSDYYTLHEYSKWLLNKDNKEVSFTINGKSTFTVNSQVILLPSLASEGKLWFDGWYTNNELTSSFTGSEITSETELYGKFSENTNNYTIIFDMRREGVSVPPITAPFNSDVTFPKNVKRGDCVVEFLETSYCDIIKSSFVMPAHDITLYAVWKCTHIETPEDLIDLSRVVNSGTTYSGTTVFLDSDLSFSGKTFEPIGAFLGTFDGQGNVISNLKMIFSSSRYVGLFWSPWGLTIKNVILDSSCSITSSYGGSVGGIVGYCFTWNRPCIIENSVNMGSVSFSGNISDYSLCIGGIAGYLYYDDYDITVKNCANYGDVTQSGESWNSNIGGLVGYSKGDSSSYRVYIYNSLNHGTITYNGTSNLYLGGIVGYTEYTTIENCVSGGKISSTPITAPNNNYIGSIVGYVYKTGIYIKYCYWTSDVGVNSLNGYGSPSIAETSSTASSLDSTLVSNLNTQATENRWNEWLLNSNSRYATFKINDSKGFSVSKKVILLPTISETGSNKFSGWYKDANYSQLFQSTPITDPTTLYGLYKIVSTVTFNPNGGSTPSPATKNVTYNDVYGTLATTTKTGYTFAGWFTEVNGGDNVTSEDIVKITGPQTLYAYWIGNVYTVTFDVNDGNVLSEYESKKEVTFGNKYEELHETTRTEHTFAGWFTVKNENITEETIVTTASNHTLYAHWSINQYTITFVFNNGDENEVRTLDFNEEIVYPENLEKTGYTFNGWDNKPDRMPAENITITALWTANQYTLSFDVNGGNALSESETEKDATYDNTYGELPKVTRTGYTFTGWFTEETGGTNTTAEDIVKITVNQTLYAHWVANVYTVKFEGNEGNPSKPSMEVTYDKEYGDLPEATRTGYTFVGWFTEKEGGEEVKSEDIVKITEDKTLYAHWSINQYTITFNSNGGSECENITQDYNTAIVLPEPTKTGYTFDCWCSDTELSKEYTETTMPAGNVTLYAKWRINQYNLTIIFNNGAENEVRTLDFNAKIVYPENVEKTGYTFNGWDNKPDRMPAENITITAQWTANKYTVTFNVNGGNVLSESESKEDVTYDSPYGDLPEATRTGYTFLGWFTEEVGGTNTTAEDIVKVTADQTLYAHWTANVYTVSFEGNEGTPSKPSMEVTFDEEYGDLPTAERTGYTFIGWFNEKNESITEESIVTISNNHTLYVHWLEISSKVEIVFGTKDLPRKEIEESIKKYTDADFEIAVIEHGVDETRVIIKFVDEKNAEKFVESVKTSSEAKATIKKVEFEFGPTTSFSPAYYPMLHLCLF